MLLLMQPRRCRIIENKEYVAKEIIDVQASPVVEETTQAVDDVGSKNTMIYLRCKVTAASVSIRV